MPPLTRRRAFPGFLAALAAASTVAAQTPSPHWVLRDSESMPFIPAPELHGDFRRAGGNSWTVVTLPGGERLAFDQYRPNTPIGMNLAAVLAFSPMVMVQTDPMTRSFFSPQELAIAETVRIRVSDSARTYAVARTENGERVIEVSPALMNLAGNLSLAILRQARGDDPEGYAFTLVIMSELDQAYGRNAWYDDGRLAWARRWSPMLTPQESAMFVAMRQGMVSAVLMHELCHHLNGDEEPQRLAALAQADPAEFRRAKRQAELEADQCSARFSARFNLDPRFQLIPLWLSSVFDDAGEQGLHPPFADRVRNIDSVGVTVTSIMVQSGQITPAQAAAANAATARMIAVAQTLDVAEALDDLAALPRGRWPDCPFGGTISSNCR